MRRLPFIFILMLAVSPFLVGRKKPLMMVQDIDAVPAAQRNLPPVLFSTSLSDSLPEAVVRKLGLEQVIGSRFTYKNGMFASYFEYNADKSALLKSLSLLPVSRYSTLADTTYREMHSDEIERMRKDVHGYEAEGASSFWNAVNGNYRAIECIKPPFRHVLLISKENNTVLHRVSPAES